MLALTVALVGPYFVDWTPYRADFEREASRILGREVKVEGSASARLLPFPSVTFTDVTVAGVEPGDTAMTIEEFSMDAELAPFLSGEILIFDMRLVRPTAVIDVGANGALDWAMRPSVPIGADHITLEKLTITEGKVMVRHAASGRTHQMTEINADISARALTGPWRMQGSLRLDGMKTAVSISTGELAENGGMRLRVHAEPERYPVTLETDGTASIEDGRALYTGNFLLNASTEVDRLRASGGETIAIVETGGHEEDAPPAYRLSGIFDFDHESLKIEEFRFATGPLEDPYTASGSAEFALGEEPRFVISADGAQVRLADAEGDTVGSLALSERIAALSEFLLDMPRPAIPGRLEVKLPAIVAGDTTVRNVHLSAEPTDTGWNIASLGATLPGRTTMEADGELTTTDDISFAGSLLLAVGQPSGFAAWLSRDVDEAIRRLPAAGFSADVELTRERQAFRDLELVLGDAKFTGEIDSRSPPDEKPSMSLRLDGDRLDVDDMAAFASLFVSEEGVNRLADHDLDFEIKAGPVVAGGMEAETLDTALRLKDGRLEVDRLSISGLAGTNVSATGIVKDLDGDLTGNIDATIIAPDLAPMLATLAQRYPGNRLAVELSRRAELYPGLFADASIDLVASAVAQGGGSGLALSANGIAGGTSFTLTGSSADAKAALAATPVKIDFSASNEEAADLYALLGLPALPIDFAGAAQTEFALSGTMEEGAQASFTFSGDGLDAGFEGTARAGQARLSLNGEASLAASDLETWLMTAGVGLPGMGLGLPVSMQAKLDYDEGLLVLSALEGEVAGSAVSGDINAGLKDGLPHLTGALTLESFDLTRLAEAVVGEAALAADGDDWPSTPFEPEVSSPVTAELEIAASRLYAGPNLNPTDARMKVRLDRQGITISDFEASAYGGTLAGLVELKNDKGTGLLSAQVQIGGMGIERMLDDIGLSGEADVTASLTASGKSVEGIVTALAGSGTASVTDLVIEGVDPDALAGILAKADSIGPEIDAAATSVFAPELVRDGSFEAGSVDIAFTIANGALRAPPIRLEAPNAVLTADVSADLGERAVRAEATLTYDPGLEDLVGSEPVVQLISAGPLDDIGTLVQTQPLAQFLTQRALEQEQRRVEAMQASLLEKQRYRREVRYYEAQREKRERAAEVARLAAAAAERRREEVRQRAEEREQAEQAEARAAEEARLKAQERDRLRREEEEAVRRQAEEEDRREAEAAEQARAAEEKRAEEERLREENERLRDEVEALLRAARQEPPSPTPPPAPTPAPSQDGILRAPLDTPAPLDIPSELGPPAETQQQRFEDLPGVSDVFSEQKLDAIGRTQ